MADALRCDVANALSGLMVSGSEELVSRVIRIRVKDGARLRFPVTVVVPFCGSYRGSYRDVVVKMVDKDGRRSYLSPLATEGTYGGQWVKLCTPDCCGWKQQAWSAASGHVMSLPGLLCRGAGVLSGPVRRRLLPEKGDLHSSHKGLVPQAEHGPPNLPELPPRMLCSSSGSTNNGTGSETHFTHLMRHSMAAVCGRLRSQGQSGSMFPQIQPMDTTLLAAAKSRTDVYHSVVSTSPVLYLIHPSSQPLRRPLTLILPCPPNLKKLEGGQEDSAAEAACRDKPAAQRR